MPFDANGLFVVAWVCLGLAALSYVACLARGSGWVDRAATVVSMAGLVAMTATLAWRGIEAGQWPLTTSYEFLLVFIWGILFVYLALERTFATKAAGAFVLPIAFLLASYALWYLPAGDKAVRPPLPALQSIWLQLHVGSSAFAYGAFAVAAAAGLMSLARGTNRGFAARLPEPERIDLITWRAVAHGFPWMTVVIITGAIWAQVAWGSYWSWDIKETWALITWLVYLLFLHARVIKGWRGRPLAIMAIGGFVVVLFTFLGMSTLARWAGLESLHVY
ncbi:MAG: c-type cytochrome biogenesis protein CcsB [Anaerolineae bacterium]